MVWVDSNQMFTFWSAQPFLGTQFQLLEGGEWGIPRLKYCLYISAKNLPNLILKQTWVALVNGGRKTFWKTGNSYEYSLFRLGCPSGCSLINVSTVNILYLYTFKYRYIRKNRSTRVYIYINIYILLSNQLHYQPLIPVEDSPVPNHQWRSDPTEVPHQIKVGHSWCLTEKAQMELKANT